MPKNRFPWDVAGKATTAIKEIIKRANVWESNIRHTTPVNAYLGGASPYGVMDMGGNVWEWQANYIDMKNGWLDLRGGSWYNDSDFARVSFGVELPLDRFNSIGFRVVATLPNG